MQFAREAGRGEGSVRRGGEWGAGGEKKASIRRWWRNARPCAQPPARTRVTRVRGGESRVSKQKPWGRGMSAPRPGEGAGLDESSKCF